MITALGLVVTCRTSPPGPLKSKRGGARELRAFLRECSRAFEGPAMSAWPFFGQSITKLVLVLTLLHFTTSAAARQLEQVGHSFVSVQMLPGGTFWLGVCESGCAQTDSLICR